MRALKLVVPLVLFLCVAQAWGQTPSREPHVGYIYPAGGKRGTTFRITIGGQFLRGATAAHVSGDGVHANVIRHYPPLRNLSQEQRVALREKFLGLFQARLAEMAEQGLVEGESIWRHLERISERGRRKNLENSESAAPADLPEHALLYDLESKSLRELLHIRYMLQQFKKGQRNAQIAEAVLVEVTIDRNAPLGTRELRIETNQGLTNPMAFEVGILPEIQETEVDDSRIADLLPKEPPLDLPVLLNGQIMPGDADRFRFRASKGQRLVVETSARQLVPYLADAVPGWFQATLTLYNAAGSELVFADDYRFNPDPVLCYDVPADGEYELEIRDSIYRGREDFVYRISVGERPFVTSIFPLGCRTGQKRFVSADGWNLCADRLFIDGQSDPAVGTRQKPLGQGKAASNPVTYDVNMLRARAEAEPNDDVEKAQRVLMPGIVDGRIEKPGDVDVFRFKGDAGDEIVVETIARQLRSPLDSLVRLIDAEGNVLGWNDDCEYKEGFLHTDMGVLTHHADSYLRAKLPDDGIYFVQVSDAQAHGGEEYAYRLRLSPPQPDFELRATPSSINLRAGLAAPIRVYASRKDGFGGEIEIAFKGDSHGFSLGGAKIPAGKDSVRITLNAPPRPLDGPVTLRLEGRAVIAMKVVTRPVVPSEDMMQAFLYRHLTPSQELMAAVRGGGRLGRNIELADKTPIRLRAGSTTRVRIAAPPHPKLREVKLALDQPPQGIALSNLAVVDGGLAFELTAGPDAQVGLADNLIIVVSTAVQRGQKNNQAIAKPRTELVPLGCLPAIPFKIIGP